MLCRVTASQEHQTTGEHLEAKSLFFLDKHHGEGTDGLNQDNNENRKLKKIGIKIDHIKVILSKQGLN